MGKKENIDKLRNKVTKIMDKIDSILDDKTLFIPIYDKNIDGSRPGFVVYNTKIPFSSVAKVFANEEYESSFNNWFNNLNYETRINILGFNIPDIENRDKKAKEA